MATNEKLAKLDGYVSDVTGSHNERVRRIGLYEDMYHMRWDVVFKEGNWVQKLPSPEPHNMLKGLVRLIVAAKRGIKVISDSDDVTYPERVEAICEQLIREADKAGPWQLLYDLGMSAALAGEAYIKVSNILDVYEHLKNKDRRRAERYLAASALRPFAMKVYSAKTVFPVYSELGLDAMGVRRQVTERYAAATWGEAALAGKNIRPEKRAEGTLVWVREWYDYDQFGIWVEGADDFAFYKENDLGFLPWAGGIVEGSGLFDLPEDQRLPPLFPVWQSGYWHAQSYADSIMYSLAMNIGKLPQMIAYLEDPSRPASDLVDNTGLLGFIKIGVNEKVEPLIKKVIDDSLQIAKTIADSRMNESVIPKQVLGTSPDRSMAFAALNLLVSNGRLPLVPIQTMAGVILGNALEIPFKWAKRTNEIYTVASPDYRLLAIDPTKYRDVRIEVTLDAKFASDDAQRMAIAGQGIQLGVWSQERAMEFVGVERPMAEQKKVERDVKTRLKIQAVAQAEAAATQQAAVQNVMSQNMQNLNMEPSAVNYQPATNPFQMCGGCIFFQGAGKPCKIVNFAIDPMMTCDYWKPMPVGNQGGANTPGATPPSGPPMMNPNTEQGGGGIPEAMVNPMSTREMATGRDNMGTAVGGGNPITTLLGG